MAKLEGVKVLDMVGGEITKVAYDGAEYVKVEGNAELGDLLYALIRNADITKYAFYEAKAPKFKNVNRFDDDIDDAAVFYEGQSITFRKISTKITPTIDERVDSLEKRVDALEEKPEPVPSFKEGDIVVITGNTTMSANEIGDIGVIAELGEDRFVVNVKGRRQGRGWTWTVPEDVRHATQAEREQYLEAMKPKKPKLKAGDWVKFAEDGTDITAGKVYEIKANADGGLYFLDDEGDDRIYPISSVSDYQFEIVAPPTAFERAGRKEGEFKIGDIVRVITGEFTLFEPGTIGELVSGAHFIHLRKFGVKHGDITQDCYDDFELIAPVESRVDAL